MRAIIFLGPTLPIEEARSILDAIYLPPARQSDVISAAINLKPDVIGLIDGVFHQSMAVWHKEILWAIERGVRVYGSSSMGALRAAETAPFGMIGVGEIYRMFAGGELIDDDEVALAHGPAETGYKKLSEPLVNLRATLKAAAAAGVIDEPTRSRLVDIAKAMFFPERALPAIVAKAGLADDVRRALSDFVSARYVDLKAEDAALLLRTIEGAPEAPRAEPPGWKLERTAAFRALLNRDRAARVGDAEIPLSAITKYVALHAPDFSALNFNALNRVLAAILAQIIGIELEPGDLEAEEERLRRRLGLGSQADFNAWLERNHFVMPDDLRALLTDAALVRRLHRWLIHRNPSQRAGRALLDHLRFEGGYEAWAERAALHEELAGSEDAGGSPEIVTQSTRDLLDEHLAWTQLKVDTDIETFAEEAGFRGDEELRRELLRARAARARAIEAIVEAADPSKSQA